MRHQEGIWNGVISNLFDEQTAIRIGKGGLKGMTLSLEMIAEWIDSFPITAYFSDTMEHLYAVPADASETRNVPRHKEEGQRWREIDADDRRRISIELSKMSHPIEDQSSHLYNIASGSFAPPESQINVAESVSISKKIVSEFRASLPSGFPATISSPLKTMENLKKGVKVSDTTMFNLETIFVRLLTIGQQGEMELAHIF